MSIRDNSFKSHNFFFIRQLARAIFCIGYECSWLFGQFQSRGVLLGIFGGCMPPNFSKPWPYIRPKWVFAITCFQTSPLRPIPIFRPKRLKNHTRLGRPYPYSLYNEILAPGGFRTTIKTFIYMKKCEPHKQFVLLWKLIMSLKSNRGMEMHPK